MGVIRVTSITFAAPPEDQVTAKVSWRLTHLPDIEENYTPCPDALVDPDGTIVDPSPYEITVPDDAVTLRIGAICGSPEVKMDFVMCGVVSVISGDIQASCPAGWDMSPDGTYCYKVESKPATYTGGSSQPFAACKTEYFNYSQFGTNIYDPGFNADGTGTRTKVETAFWKNIPSNTASGPLNRCGIKPCSSSYQANVFYGFSIPLDLPESKTYYIGIAGDNRCQIKVDGVVIITQVPSHLGSQDMIDAQAAFKFWHVYPIELTAGLHYIELGGANDDTTSPYSFGLEIYNATKSQLLTATSYADVGLVFSTKDVVGQTLQTGQYVCESGWSLDYNNGSPLCKRILTTPPL